MKFCTNGASSHDHEGPTPIYCKNPSKHFPPEPEADRSETWYVAFGMPARYNIF